MSLPPALVEEVIFSVASMCVSVCVSVCTLQAEPLDLWTYNLAYILKTIISQTSLNVKVIGQRSRSQGRKF